MTAFDLRAVNSATKYPSIPTYHSLDASNGVLVEKPWNFEGASSVIVTEKIDGTNTRIVTLPGGDYIIGSREELLTFKGDRIPNPMLGIVDAVRDIAEKLTPVPASLPLLGVYYGEVYGGKLPKARDYSGDGKVGFRLFDVAFIPTDILDLPVQRIATWRQNWGQQFVLWSELLEIEAKEGLTLVPPLANLEPSELPVSIEDTYTFLKEYAPATRALLDELGRGRSEGVVFRSRDRYTITKARFSDYERTLRKRGAT